LRILPKAFNVFQCLTYNISSFHEVIQQEKIGMAICQKGGDVRIVLATKNKKKVEELTRMFSGRAIIFETLDVFPGCPEVIEDGRTFRQNAVKKAAAIAQYTGCPALADDSGLEVDALGGAPGVYSARYAG